MCTSTTVDSKHFEAMWPKRAVWCVMNENEILLFANRIEIENGNSNNHIEISGFKLDYRLTIINVYNNPSSSLDLLKEMLLELKDYIDESENILILGDFNHELKLYTPPL
ncbi:hypothetical protein PVAND_013477 [Polypedilum vanderplanki]|uniref:Endonuclease/exonuclease/phosphatase domain-containing protein n=1 Tax=Polypedilum vanderplanki TaxID=319348 RepID=A0A9J6CQL5_POLVA|nr:hypothetical protein PVAND_013477 [Polypedilum vanderplanki]